MFDSRSIFLNVIEELEASQAFLKSQNASSWPSPHLQVGSVLCLRVSRSPVQVNLDIKSSKCARGTGVKMQAQNPLFLKLWPSHWSNRGVSAASRQNVLMDVLSWGILSRQIWCRADITSWFEKRLFSVTRRSRSDVSHLLTESLTESWLADLTDVTLVSEDTY